MNSTPTSIEEILSGSPDIVSPPEIFLKVSEILDDPTKNAYDAGRIIETDPGLTSRLLKIVNSALFGFPTKIDTISRALPIIGVIQLRHLVLATVIIDRFANLPSKIPSIREFWQQSVQCALYSREIAHIHAQSIEPSVLFVCGLLHNIGCLLIYYREPELANAAIEYAFDHKLPNYMGEQHILGFDRFEIGGELAKLWQLPDIIEITIRNHEIPNTSKDYKLETSIVSFSDQIIRASQTMQHNDEFPIFYTAEQLSQLKLSPELISSISVEVDSHFKQIFSQIFQ